MVIPVLITGCWSRKLAIAHTQQTKPRILLLQNLSIQIFNHFKNYKLTLEFTSNPAWYAIQALPYMMEYPYECAEQVFDRFYANSIATHIANSYPKIKAVFDRWKNLPLMLFFLTLKRIRI